MKAEFKRHLFAAMCGYVVEYLESTSKTGIVELTAADRSFIMRWLSTIAVTPGACPLNGSQVAMHLSWYSTQQLHHNSVAVPLSRFCEPLLLIRDYLDSLEQETVTLSGEDNEFQVRWMTLVVDHKHGPHASTLVKVLAILDKVKELNGEPEDADHCEEEAVRTGPTTD